MSTSQPARIKAPSDGYCRRVNVTPVAARPSLPRSAGWPPATGSMQGTMTSNARPTRVLIMNLAEALPKELGF